jgi:glycosyltransferase involved in cell wall biosynthesis
MLDLNTGLPNLAAQKYHRLLAQGMALNENLMSVQVLSVPEFSNQWNRFIIISSEEVENGVKYDYCPIVFFPGIKWLIVSSYLIAKILNWRLRGNSKNRYIIFDILNLSTSLVALVASKVFFVKSIAIVTDLPELMYVLQPKIYLSNKVTYLFKNFLLKLCSGYVFLTNEMNNFINKKNKPYCIIEGLADIKINTESVEVYKAKGAKIIHYSGGLYEKFGVKTLIEAFMLLKREDIKLHIFGNGDLVEYITKCKAIDNRIEFFGYKNNDIVLSDQFNSLILVNPRFSKGLYNQFSFPSKTIEYMVSGVPLLTTRLPGIPREYFEFTYVFDEENVESFKHAIEKILEIPPMELSLFGSKAKKFILDNKNNKVQAEKFFNVFSKV